MSNTTAKGPWSHSSIEDYKIHDANGVVVCKYYVSEDTEDQDLANARLIRAAPEMLEALEIALKEIKSASKILVVDDEIEMIETVIAKAKGESRG